METEKWIKHFDTEVTLSFIKENGKPENEKPLLDIRKLNDCSNSVVLETYDLNKKFRILFDSRKEALKEAKEIMKKY